ncbi:MAG: hypothetical protein ACRD07_20975 [Acidimicrobiales bacterium]
MQETQTDAVGELDRSIVVEFPLRGEWTVERTPADRDGRWRPVHNGIPERLERVRSAGTGR